ncbi:MAG TPA: carbon-nitrogen hydrolase family protein [Polyangiaceae bacterium]|jgi:predicted amidohydrolase|nr:carbon-nitrogen hydrolase family protein [Polyangiaceae bacterium]
MKLLLVQPALSYAPSADNLGIVTRIAERFAADLGPDDIVLLPEHFDLRPWREEYEAGVSALARRLGCHVVGGSHHEEREGGRVNSGVVANPRGTIVSRYEKVRPYATERERVQEGNAFGELTIAGRSVLVLICADFWFSDLFARAAALPDVVLVPALSVTRKPTPHYSRALWQHLAVARAYEFGTYVGISDWAHVPTPEHLFFASGVAGFADPTTLDPAAFFRPLNGDARLYDLDFEALSVFRKDRRDRGFFWKRLPPDP